MKWLISNEVFVLPLEYLIDLYDKYFECKYLWILFVAKDG